MHQSQFFTIDAQHRSRNAIVRVGRSHHAEPLDHLLHIGDGYRLDLCLSERPGNSRVRYRDLWTPNRFAPVGDLFLARDDEPLLARCEPGSGDSMSCRLKPEALSAWFDGDLRWTDPVLEESLDLGSIALKNLLRRMVIELRNPGFAHDVLMESLVAQVAVELSRYCTVISGRKPEGELAPWRLRRIDERLSECIDAPSLEELARLCSLSVRQLTRGFRGSRGRSIADHIADKRLQHATRMLREGQSIKTVANSVGYASVSSFTYAFRRSVGVTPGEFRKSRPDA